MDLWSLIFHPRVWHTMDASNDSFLLSHIGFSPFIGLPPHPPALLPCLLGAALCRIHSTTLSHPPETPPYWQAAWTATGEVQRGHGRLGGWRCCPGCRGGRPLTRGPRQTATLSGCTWGPESQLRACVGPAALSPSSMLRSEPELGGGLGNPDWGQRLGEDISPKKEGRWTGLSPTWSVYLWALC